MASIATKKNILISGGSIAGPSVAFWLNRYGFKTTLVERWDGVRPGGQNVDVENAGREALKRMGLEADVLALHTKETGTNWITTDGRSRLDMPMTGAVSATNESEIQRGDFAQLLYDKTKSETEWIFRDQIVAINERDDGVQVEFQSGKKGDYHAVVLADGVGSRTRKLILGPDDYSFKPLGLYIAYWAIPREPSDPFYDKWQITPLPGRRLLSSRPERTATYTNVFLMFLSPKSQGFEKLPKSEQVEALKPYLRGSGKYEARYIAGLEKDKDLYLDYTGQIHAKRWYSAGGRVALVGDAAYCATPVSGMGTPLSLVGAYILAGELAKHANDPKKGVQEYQRLMTPYVKETQTLAPGIPSIAMPNSKWGIEVMYWILRTIVAVARFWSWSGLGRLVQRFSGPPKPEIDLPDYTALEVGRSSEAKKF
ncbi:hypothetical protein CI109_102038 [Kwoniella shandongensis]|uniref:Uncharacterized protein n=1 Tax=Kwoniella shandongensis TaxID=1734106 RepID=A0A5M6BQD1_9TREE|nr:uncharacterized protein CI109_007383 [Kwoniella shandongensis]KAA5524291.1 hypothetical protein CI109_007383 [Kwoniella shandongensis]